MSHPLAAFLDRQRPQGERTVTGFLAYLLASCSDDVQSIVGLNPSDKPLIRAALEGCIFLRDDRFASVGYAAARARLKAQAEVGR